MPLLALLFAVQAMTTLDTPLSGPNGSEIGSVRLIEAPRGILVRIDVSGLEPGWHGVHLHQKADCSDPAFKNSGGHVHGAGVPQSVHGLLNPRATDLGDIPNIHASDNGDAKAEFFVPDLALAPATGRYNLRDSDGAALVIHAQADDHRSQPIGGAGARVACALIR